MKRPGQVYFYRVKVIRDNGQYGIREGTLQAPWPLTALDEIQRMSIEEWKRPLQKIELFETDKHGELVATTTVGERLDRVLNTHRALKPEGGIAKMAERREKRAKPEQKPKTTYTPPPPKYDRMTEWNWSAEVGNRYVPMSFACPSFKEKVT